MGLRVNPTLVVGLVPIGNYAGDAARQRESISRRVGYVAPRVDDRKREAFVVVDEDVLSGLRSIGKDGDLTLPPVP